jgi:hypothetical protein
MEKAVILTDIKGKSLVIPPVTVQRVRQVFCVNGQAKSSSLID